MYRNRNTERQHRIISILMIVVLILTGSGIDSYAAGFSRFDTVEDITSTDENIETEEHGETEEIDESDTENDITQVGVSEEADIISEVLDARDEYTKEYILSDDSRAVVVYPEPVHYENEDGTFVEIDNTLIETEEGYENADNAYHVLFTDNEDSKGEVIFEEDEYLISWKIAETVLANTVSNNSVSDNSVSDNSVSQNEASVFSVSDNSVSGNGIIKKDIQITDESEVHVTDDTELEASVNTPGIDPEEEENFGHIIKHSTVTFDGYEGGYQLEYMPTGNGVKENIILPFKGCDNSFTFKIRLNGLKARVNSANIVELYDEETESIKYYFPEPYMEDSQGRRSANVRYSLSETYPVFNDDTESVTDDSEETHDEDADKDGSEDKEDNEGSESDENNDDDKVDTDDNEKVREPDHEKEETKDEEGSKEDKHINDTVEPAVMTPGLNSLMTLPMDRDNGPVEEELNSKDDETEDETDKETEEDIITP